MRTPAPSFRQPLHRLIHLLSFLIVLDASEIMTNRSDLPAKCPPFQCGDGGVLIEYPFWQPMSLLGSNYYCGYPDFRVSCSGDTPMFNTSTNSYVVKAIDYTNQTISLIDADVLNDDCPKVHHPLDISYTNILQLSPSDVQLEFFFECTPQEQFASNLVECLSNKTGKGASSYVFHVVNDGIYNGIRQNLSKDCVGGSVTSTVLLEQWKGIGENKSRFGSVLQQGFELTWKKTIYQNSAGCEKSNGRCGYEVKETGLQDFKCYCKDGRVTSTDSLTSFAQENCDRFNSYNISCSEDTNHQTIIVINGISYRLLTDITDDSTLILAPTTTISPNNCSSLPTQNTTLESSVLSYTDQTVILTLYRCPPSPPSPLNSPIGCSDNPNDVSWFYLPPSYSNTSISYMNCLTIILPVLENATEGVLDEKWDWEYFISAYDGGFEVTFNSDKSSPKKILVIALPVVFGFLVLAGLCFVCYKRRKGGKIIFRQTSSTRNSFIKTAAAFSLDRSKYKVDIESQSSSPYLKPPHIFTYKELDEATDGFHSDREIGDGGFGTVYKGFLRDGRTVAVKRLYENNHKRLEQFLNEVKIVEPLRHPNLVTLYGCTSHHSRELLLVYEFVCNGTVADHLHGPRASERVLTWPLRMNTAIEAADALAHLHAIEPPVIHRDVKTNNILLDDSFHVKVADFGLSRLFPLDATHVSTAPQGTPGYVDPDYYNCYQLTDKSDVYSLGVVLVELISSKPAVDITRKRQDINLSKMAVNKITKGLIHELADPELGYQTDPEVKRQIQATAQVAFLCLQSDKDTRPPMKLVKTMLCEILTPPHNGPDGPPPYDGTDADKKHSGLLEGPVSPDTVMSKWYSRVTTPNSSV